MIKVIKVYYYPVQCAPQARYGCLAEKFDTNEVLLCSEKLCNQECGISDTFSLENAARLGLI